MVLSLLKEKYRDDIVFQLMQEEEQSKQKIIPKKAKPKKKLKEKEGFKESNKVEEYDEDYWQSFEFYKYYFDDDNDLESLIVTTTSNYDKPKQKKKKAKKITTLTTRHTSDAASFDNSSCPIYNESIKNNEAEEYLEQLKDDDIKITGDYLEDQIITPEDTINEENAIPNESPVEPKNEASSEVIQPDTVIPDKENNEQKPISKKKSKKINKASRLANKKTVAEYEEFKEKTLQFFAHLTDSTLPQKKISKSKKVNNKSNLKSKKNKESNKKVNNGNKKIEVKEEPIIEPSYNEYNDDLYYDDDEIVPESEPWEENYPIENLLSPYVGSVSESEFFNKLNQDIASFASSIEAHNKSLAIITEDLHNVLLKFVRDSFDGIFCISIDDKLTLSLYGSAASGFALPTSDIDLGVCGLKLINKEEITEAMNRIAEKLKSENMVSKVTVIPFASVPVIKMVFNLGYLRPEWDGCTNNVDLTFDEFLENQQHPIKYGVLFSGWITTKRTELPHLFPLVVVIKKLLALRKLNIPYYGILFRKYRWIKLICTYINGCRISKDMPRLPYSGT